MFYSKSAQVSYPFKIFSNKLKVIVRLLRLFPLPLFSKYSEQQDGTSLQQQQVSPRNGTTEAEKVEVCFRLQITKITCI